MGSADGGSLKVSWKCLEASVSVRKCLEVSGRVRKRGVFLFAKALCSCSGWTQLVVSAVDKDLRRQRPPTIQQFDIWTISVLRFQSCYTITWKNIGEKYLESGSPSQEGQGT